MIDLSEKIELLISDTSNYVQNLPQDDLLYKKTELKWSKKEILGHLIDSAINNLQRFTEIQFLPQPYILKQYRQDDLVIVNQYQKEALEKMLNLWQALNYQICYVILSLTDEMLNYEVQIGDIEIKSLEWLINDYAVHMEHHIKQIKAEINTK